MTFSGKEKLTNSVIKNDYSNRNDVIDYKDWSVGHSRKNNALNLYLTINLFGLDKYKDSLRKLVFLAEIFSKLIEKDKDLVFICKRELGLNCFRVYNKDKTN